MRELTREYLEQLGIQVGNIDGEDCILTNDGKKRKYLAVGAPKRYPELTYDVFTHYIRGTYYVDENGDAHQKGVCLSVARSIYAWYKGICPANMAIEHIDGNTHNNNIDNLKLVTHQEALKKRRVSRNQYTYILSEEKAIEKRDNDLVYWLRQRLVVHYPKAFNITEIWNQEKAAFLEYCHNTTYRLSYKKADDYIELNKERLDEVLK